jgi:hypothetical protein
MTTMLAVAVAGATLGSGCTTFTDNDAVARVGDVELSSDELRARADASDAPRGVALDANFVRQEIGSWVDEQIAAGVDPAVAAATYPQGLLVSGSVCFQVIVVENVQSAADGVDELLAGADFATVFAARNIDPSLATEEGRFGCVPADQLPLGTGNAFVDALAGLDSDSEFAWVELPANPDEPVLGAVIRFLPYEELGPDETPIVLANLPADAQEVDIYIDPRYGTYDAAAGVVVALG